MSQYERCRTQIWNMLQQKFSFRYMLLEQAREWGRRCMKGRYQRKRRIHTIERARNYVSIYLSILRLIMISCLESIELCHPFIPIIHSLIELDAIPARESEKIYHEPNEKTGGMRKDVTIVLIETPSSISESNWQNYAGAIVNNNYAYGAAKRQSFSIIFSKYYQLSIQFIYGCNIWGNHTDFCIGCSKDMVGGIAHICNPKLDKGRNCWKNLHDSRYSDDIERPRLGSKRKAQPSNQSKRKKPKKEKKRKSLNPLFHS